MNNRAETWLFVPTKEKYLKKISDSRADYIILDLEDSLSETEKDMGLGLAAEFLGSAGDRKDRFFVRVNRGPGLKKELQSLSEIPFAGYMVPKFEGTEILDRYQACFSDRKIIALAETPAGIIHLPQFAGDQRISALALGGEDFCSTLGVRTNRAALQTARGQLVLWAKYYGKTALDTVCFEYHDREIFLNEYDYAMDMGFDSKLLIHPFQVQAVQEYTGNMSEPEIREIIRAFESSGKGVAVINGIVYERPHIERLRSLIKEKI